MIRELKTKICFTVIFAPQLFTLSTAIPQTYKIEDIELVNMGNYYRVMIHCDGPVRYVDRFTSSPPELNLYIRDAAVALKNPTLQYKNPVVQSIKATRWKKYPAVVKISVAFRRPTEYQVADMMDGGMIYVDIKDAQNGSSVPSTRSEVQNPKTTHDSADEPEPIAINKYPPDDLPEPLLNREPITLDVRAAQMSNVLRLLAKQSGLNIVASKDVTGRVTVSLVGVTVKEALDLIAKANGYDYVVSGDVILVKPREKFELEELQTKVYRLKYVDANSLKPMLSQVLSPQAKIQVFYHDFQATAEKEEGSGKEGEETRRSSTLLVTDIPANFKQLEAMIEALDVPTPQIMIEAKLIEISPQDEQKLGINWTKTINAQIFQEVLLPSGQAFRYSAEAPLDGGSVSFGTLTLSEYGAVLDFLNSHTNTKLVSNPRILAMDNQEAVISVGNNVPIPQINRGVGGQGDIVTFEYRDVNISLRVTPHVAEDETIALYVNPIIEEITGEVVAGENSAPITSKREVKTVVNLKSNETMVIGGLIKESTIDTIDKVWLLGDIPLIGNFFRHRNKTKKQTDLLIFITPRLLQNP